MSYDIYEIVIRGVGGQYKGASMQVTESAERKFIADAQWPELCAAINAAALARVDVLDAQLVAAQTAHDAAIATAQAQLDAYKARGLQAAQIVARIIDDPAMTPEQKTAAIKAVTTDIQANERERQRLAALAELASAQAKVAAFN